MRVAGYRFRVTFGDRWGGYLALVLLIGLVGGLALGAVAAARRTQAAFPAYLASTNSSDLTVLTGLSGPGSGYDPALIRKIAGLPDVRRVENYALMDAAVLAPNGTVAFNAMGIPGSIDGEYFTQDRPTIVQGRMANPNRADEVVIDAKGTPASVHVGQVIPFAFFTNAQETSPDFGRPGMKPYLRINVRVVGKAIFSQEVVQDDIDTGRNGGVLFTPALTRRLVGCCIVGTESAVQLSGGSGDVAPAEAGIERLLPKGFPIEFYLTSLTTAKAERAIRPESISLAVFGGIAGLAALVIAGQVIGRQLRLGARDLGTMRALGAGPAMTVADGLPGILAAVVAGSVVAIVLSPLAPLGSVRAVYPYLGVALDWTVLGVGAAALTGVLFLVAVVFAYRDAPHRATPQGQAVPGPESTIVHSAAALSPPPSVVEGLRLAVDPGTGRNAVPVRSAILGAALAMVAMVATVTFGSSLDTLVSHPALYGWNWTYALSPGNPSYIPRARAAALLDRDRAVATWTGVWFGAVKIDGLTVPVMGLSPGAPIAPPVLSGHDVRTAGQVVLGATTLAQLHKHIGDEVTILNGGGGRFRLRIAGVATLPSYGIQGTLHTEMGTGAVLAYRVIPGAATSQPNDILVTLRPGADRAAAARELQRLVPVDPGGGEVIPVQRPAEIVNYRSMGATPALLGAALAAGAVAALALTLFASVRRRRRDLALLKTIGFTRRQLAAAVAWQSTIAVALGAVVGVPLGIALGRFLWDLFAREISVVPEPTVPGPAVVLIAVGALVLANIVAAVPGRLAGRTPTALLLRAE